VLTLRYAWRWCLSLSMQFGGDQSQPKTEETTQNPWNSSRYWSMKVRLVFRGLRRTKQKSKRKAKSDASPAASLHRRFRDHRSKATSHNGHRLVTYILQSFQGPLTDNMKWAKYKTSPDKETSSKYWLQLSRFNIKTKTESSLRNAVFWIKAVLNKRQDDG
jgi:hypothetical protein